MSGTVAGLISGSLGRDTGHWCSVSHEADLLRPDQAFPQECGSGTVALSLRIRPWARQCDCREETFIPLCEERSLESLTVII